MKKIEKNTWNRKEHFEFFSQFDEPFLGLVSEVDCKFAYQTAKEKGYSFFAYYLHKCLQAINDIPEFKCRIVDNEILIYDTIHISPTIGREDGTFGFAFVPFYSDFEKFNEALQEEITAVKKSMGIRLNENTKRADVIHFSSLPWTKFTGLSHPRNFQFIDSVPKISFGKATHQGEKMSLPVSVHAHHGLVDGLHVARFLEKFQEYLEDR